MDGIYDCLLSRGAERSSKYSSSAPVVDASFMLRRPYSSTALCPIVSNVLVIVMMNHVLDSTDMTIVSATAFVWTRLCILASNIAAAQTTETTYPSACPTTLNTTDSMPSFKSNYVDFNASLNVDSKALRICDSSVLDHLVRKLLTIASASVSNTAPRAANMRSISLLMPNSGLKTNLPGGCGL